MTRKLLLLLPVMALLVSGCTIPGTDINIPFLGGGETAYENDVVVIRSMDAFPARAAPDQEITVRAYVQNIAERGIEKVTVNLYDYCDGLFQTDKIKTTCPPTQTKTGTDTKCENIQLLPDETKVVEWKLTPAKNIELMTPCDLKVSVNYPYSTKSVTSLHLIDTLEYQRQLQEGKFAVKTSSKTLGQGPLKAGWDVKTPQPIVVSKDTETQLSLTLDVENRGRGFVKDNKFTITANSMEPDNDITVVPADCKAVKGAKETLIQNRRSLPCNVKIKKEVVKELTKQLEVEIKYDYEFRAQRHVEVIPLIKR